MVELYATILEDYTSQLAAARGFKVRGHAGFQRDHRTTNHILTLRVIIEEVMFQKILVFSFFIDFRKAFDTVPCHRLMDRLRRLGIPKLILTTILILYESVSGRLDTAECLFDMSHSTIGVKQGCSLSSTLFGLYIDELESLILETTGIKTGCLLHNPRVPILLFLDDIVLLSHTTKGL